MAAETKPGWPQQKEKTSVVSDGDTKATTLLPFTALYRAKTQGSVNKPLKKLKCRVFVSSHNDILRETIKVMPNQRKCCHSQNKWCSQVRLGVADSVLGFLPSSTHHSPSQTLSTTIFPPKTVFFFGSLI